MKRTERRGASWEKWEQGQAKPNPQVPALVLLLRHCPDTVEQLEKVAAG